MIEIGKRGENTLILMSESNRVPPAAAETSLPRKKMTKQLTGKRDDTPLHSAARAGNLTAAMEILTDTDEMDLRELLAKQNHSGETALYVAAEYGYVDLVRELLKYYDLADAEIKARNGFDAFHIATKQGDLGMFNLISSQISVFLPLKSDLIKAVPYCRDIESFNGGPSGIIHDCRHIEHDRIAYRSDARPYRDCGLSIGSR